MKLSVVIPALNEAGEIGGAVTSAAGSGVEILVVDGGSGDATRERAQKAGARVIVSAPGRAQQLEAGVRAALGEVLVFLHADTRLPGGFDTAIREALSDESVVGGAFRLRFDRSTPALRAVEWGARLRATWLGLPYGDQALFARRAAIDRIGGVPQAPIMEDLDLVRSLRRLGRMRVLPLPVTTSARHYLDRGVWRTALRNGVAALAWWLGVDRARVSRWYRS